MKLLLLLSLVSILVVADEEPRSFPGLLSSEVFNLDGGLEMFVEQRETCDQAGVQKHFHPAAGTLVYVLDGVSQSESSGEWKNYYQGEYWFEPTDWVHGGEPDIAAVEGCTKLLVIRVVEEGKAPTVFID
mgnify:FL=1